MSAAMDRALMALSLEEEDEPLDLPDLPQFSSVERNVMSLIGRTLNPACQNMAGLIISLPRKWQKVGKVRGVALSDEKFQFIFDHEHDLIEILEKGVHTHNEWAVALERWVENPPEDYLQFVPIWVQIRKLPVNHYTEATIMSIGERLGRLDEVAFDPKVSQTQDCVRVKIRFDVTRPLKRYQKINLPGGGQATVELTYERIQLRCYKCQRLIHHRDVCPLLDKDRLNQDVEREKIILEEKLKKASTIAENDPLFGVLNEDQIGISPATGRPKIVKEVLDEMRNYLLFANVGDLNVRQERVRQSVHEVEQDPIAQKSMFRLEPPTVFTKDVSKGKGIVFEFGKQDKMQSIQTMKDNEAKFLGKAISSGNREEWVQELQQFKYASDSEVSWGIQSQSQVSSTVSRSVSMEACSSGANTSKQKARRRPSKARRNQHVAKPFKTSTQMFKKAGIEVGGAMKRKEKPALESISKVAKCAHPKVIPHEGLPYQ